jgi:uroporphyrinogen decarboxylase
MYQRPDLMHQILKVNADAVASYLNAQIAAGAQAVMIFDSWGGVLADGAFQEFSLAYTEHVLSKVVSVHDGVTIPRIVFTKGGGQWLGDMGSLNCDVLGVDWTVNLNRARALVGDRYALQGNLDPMVLFADSDSVAREARRVLDDFGRPHMGDSLGPTHIFNLGHGINQHTPPENVAVLVQAVHEYSRTLRTQV